MTNIEVHCAVCNWSTAALLVPYTTDSELQMQADRIVGDHYRLLIIEGTPHATPPAQWIKV